MKGSLAKALLAIATILALLLLLPDPHSSANRFSARIPSNAMEKQQMPPLLGGDLDALVDRGKAVVKHPALGKVYVCSTVDPELQKKAEALLKGQRSLRAAVAMVDAHSGRVLVLAGAKGRRLDPYQALDSNAPAASLFKLVTAAAALEETPLHPESQMRYCGRYTTLYRYQLKDKLRRWVTEVSLARSFAQSNNPVFGRLGALRLGEDMLTRYARLLGFETHLSFELPLGQSELLDPDDKYSLAEMASGFNRITSLSPIHAALLVGAFVNGGRLAQPYLVEEAYDEKGRVIYVGRPNLGQPVVSPQTCEHMRQLLQATITCGTARKAFRNHNRDRVLKNLELGGKTGTIRGQNRAELYQWFAGYGRDPLTGRTYAVAALAVHGKIRYTNPRKLAASMLKAAFSRPHIAAAH